MSHSTADDPAASASPGCPAAMANDASLKSESTTNADAVMAPSESTGRAAPIIPISRAPRPKPGHERPADRTARPVSGRTFRIASDGTLIARDGGIHVYDHANDRVVPTGITSLVERRRSDEHRKQLAEWEAERTAAAARRMTPEYRKAHERGQAVVRMLERAIEAVEP